ncbi:uncharacterized protein BDZ99DRAFT_460079 [Mytilinidion resinicola]|uniref:Uncharacterized protein n=1 Tax=Mytilinidion resinicola TaxID=574789 RepID=A0A6A6Z2A2_9PEZI|nr:uncharacterized protein BDZ99DRAFT_460079 [Mytilinidion resinicola]KAF2814424.1 hypothetical protein BDZ99DRAFT_460079 [Mytilinidion resinicola]
MHRQWLEPNQTNRTNLEFSSFLAKAIDIERPVYSTGSCPTEEVVALHKALCSQANNFDPSKHPDSVVTGYNHDQRHLYHVKPLFRSLIILQTQDHEPAEDPYKKAYRLIRTLDESQLSAPIDFGPIQDDCEGYVDSNTTEVMTDLITAVNFTLQLESRENAFAGEAIDAKVLDDRLGNEDCTNIRAASWGYTGPRIQGPSSDWVDGDRRMLKNRLFYSCRWKSEGWCSGTPP